MLDNYFKRPIFWDYTIAILVAAILFLLYNSGRIINPSQSQLYSLLSDLSTISLTLAGFVITLLTVLVSFKSSENSTPKEIIPGEAVFKVFFKTRLYFQTVDLLKRAAASLTIVAIIGFCLKLMMIPNIILYLFNVSGIVILLLTLGRCLLILSKIIALQKT